MNIDKQDTDQQSMFILKACNEEVIMLTTDSTIQMTAEICSTHSFNPKISRIIVFHQLIFCIFQPYRLILGLALLLLSSLTAVGNGMVLHAIR